MTGSTPVVNITFHRSKLPEDPGYSEAHYVYYDLVRSLLLLPIALCRHPLLLPLILSNFREFLFYSRGADIHHLCFGRQISGKKYV